MINLQNMLSPNEQVLYKKSWKRTDRNYGPYRDQIKTTEETIYVINKKVIHVNDGCVRVYVLKDISIINFSDNRASFNGPDWHIYFSSSSAPNTPMGYFDFDSLQDAQEVFIELDKYI